MSKPTPEEILLSFGGYKRLFARRICSRNVIVLAKWSSFMFGVGLEVCAFGVIWFVGPISFCFAKVNAS